MALIKMKDGTMVHACVKPGETLTEEDEAAIAEYVQFCRDRKEKKEQQLANRTKQPRAGV